MKMTNRELETRYMHIKQTWKTLVDANVNLVDENKEIKEEIERLNNNWNELEKFICDLEIECNIDNSMWGVAVIIHNKLKELEGSDSNE